MKNALEDLVNAYTEWRQSPKKSRTTPHYLLQATAQLVDDVPPTVLIQRLGISSALLKRARSLKLELDRQQVCERPLLDESLEPQSFFALDFPFTEPKPHNASALSSKNITPISASTLSMELPFGGQTITVKGSVEQISQVLTQLVKGGLS